MIRPDNQRECFQCMECSIEFVGPTDLSRGMPELLSFPCKKGNCCICMERKNQCHDRDCVMCRTRKLGGLCRNGSCPGCGSKYVEWLTYDTKDTDVYLDVEWQSGDRCYKGSYEISTEN